MPVVGTRFDRDAALASLTFGVIASFDRYLEIGKPLESVYRGRGLAKSELGRYPGAIKDFTKVLELQPTSAARLVA